MSIDKDQLTPAMQQFHRFKQKFPDCVLFFRMGDFYETFYDDARITSETCGLTLTARNKGANPIPLAGVPYHAVDGYLKKMISAGHKVAVCEQIEDPKLAKGVVKRDVVRIITAGTLTDDMLLEEKQNNFLAAVYLGKKSAAVSWVDLSTGHFFTENIAENRLIDELLRIGPAEVILPQSRGELFDAEFKKIAGQIHSLSSAVITLRPGWYFDAVSAQKKLCEHFGVAGLEGFGIADNEDCIAPAGAIIEYLNETQKTALKHIILLKKFNRRQFLQIDQASLRSLEILGVIRGGTAKNSLLGSIDQTLTAMGGRMIRQWFCMPLCEISPIELRHDAVEELCGNAQILNKLRSLFKQIADIERIAARLATGRATPRDLLALAQSLRQAGEVKNLLMQCRADLLSSTGGRIDTMNELAERLESAIEPQCPTHLRDGGVIRPGFDAELDRLRSVGKSGRDFLAEYQQQQIKRTGIANLKIGFNQVFGYYIEITNSYADKVPPDYIRRQTVKNAERYITEPLKKYEEQALTASQKALEIEQKIFEQLRSFAAEHIPRLAALAECIAQCDCLAALAYLAGRENYIRPQMTNEKILSITDGKHPVLAGLLGSEFVPNDIQLGNGKADIAIITGPNMSGKSTYIRQTALLVIMAQAGSFLPAKNATIGITDKIFTRVGASDELTRGQSTFMVEMTETANILNNATERSLVILDEVGRGTSTHDGLALAWAITEHLANNIKCRTLFATHYHELTELAGLLVNVKNLNVAVREWMDEVVFLHKIVPGGTDKSYGIHVAKLAGVPKQITTRASEILKDLENAFAKEAHNVELGKARTQNESAEPLFSRAQKNALDKLGRLDVNKLTPIEAINLLAEIQKQITDGK